MKNVIEKLRGLKLVTWLATAVIAIVIILVVMSMVDAPSEHGHTH
jgi:hypothetical protein